MKISFVKNVESAARFVYEKGNALEQACLSCILYRHPVSDGVYASFQDAQNEDGGWQSFVSPGFSSLDASCFHLSQACQLGLEGSKTWNKTLRFLRTRQAEDGSWEETFPTGVAPSPWLAPGDEKGRIYLTSNCGFWLSFLKDAQPHTHAAARYLAARQEEDGHLNSFLQAHWLAGSLWLRLGMASLAERILDYLQKRLTQLSAGEMAWMLNSFHLSNLPHTHPVFQRGIPLLLSMQQPDGHWCSDDGEEFDVQTTLDTLVVLSAMYKSRP